MHLTEEENKKFYATESKNRIKFYVFFINEDMPNSLSRLTNI